LIINATSQQV